MQKNAEKKKRECVCAKEIDGTNRNIGKWRMNIDKNASREFDIVGFLYALSMLTPDIIYLFYFILYFKCLCVCVRLVDHHHRRRRRYRHVRLRILQYVVVN